MRQQREVLKRLQGSVGREQLFKKRGNRKNKTKHLLSFHVITKEGEQTHIEDYPERVINSVPGPGQLCTATIRDFRSSFYQLQARNPISKS